MVTCFVPVGCLCILLTGQVLSNHAPPQTSHSKPQPACWTL
ncbi:hypothetical protein AO369_0452 [Moraxella catarrhalis]|nr:hypothetical protein AO369_0452 [Moraxella catarrhalis]